MKMIWTTTKDKDRKDKCKTNYKGALDLRKGTTRIIPRLLVKIP